MLYFKYFSDAGVAATGLTPVFIALETATNQTDKMASKPSFTELGNGWYRFTVTLGTAPWDVVGEDLVGLIDGGATLVDSDRYKPFLLTKRELALNAIMQNLIVETVGIADSSGRVDVSKLKGLTTALNNLEDDYDGTGYNKSASTIGTVTTYTGNTKQTGDNFARLGAPAGASVSADVAAVKAETVLIVEDTGTTLPATLATLATASALSTVDGKVDTISTNVDAVLLDTGTTLPATLATLATASALSTVDGKVDTIDGIVDTILTSVEKNRKTLSNRVVVTPGSPSVVVVYEDDDSTPAFTLNVSADGNTRTVV